MKRISILLAIVASLTVAGSAMAAPQPKMTGTIGLSGPTQFVSFEVFDNPDRGGVRYTNWQAAAPGGDVWLADVDASAMTACLGASPYPWTMTITSSTPTGLTTSTFAGTAVYDADASYTADLAGTITGDHIVFSLRYTGTSSGHVFTGTGDIASDGSATGTGVDTLGQSPLSFSWSGFAHEVLAYSATISTVEVDSAERTASFAYTIPAGNPYSGIVVDMSATDGGSSGAGNDTFTLLGDSYTIVSGNLTVQ